MRNLFKWGTARIQQGAVSLPNYAKEALGNTVENIRLSRTTINHILSAHKLNGYLNIDDYSRYLLLAEQLDHAPHTNEITQMLRCSW